jgi:Protein of unknown function (DUF3723)
MLLQYTTIVGGEEPFLLDSKTIHLLETLIPAYSTVDFERIKILMHEGKIFGAITSPARRQKILDNILGIDGRILSFHTFFQDTIYFGACSRILQGLLQPKFEGTVRQAFFRSYQRDPNRHRIRIQSRQGRVNDRPGTEEVHLPLAYRQMFLAAMRDFPLLGSLAPLWDAKKPKRLVQGSASERWYQLASLAFVLGFRSARITQLMEGGSENEIMAREFLSRVRPPEIYEINEQSRNDLVRYIALHIDDFATPRINSTEPEYTTNREGLTKEQRCNRPYETAYRRDKNHLYIENMYIVHITPRAFVTSLAIQRDIFICFLGITNLENIRADSLPEGSDVGSFPDVTRPSIRAPTSDAAIAVEAGETTIPTPAPVDATALNNIPTFESGSNLEISGTVQSPEHILLYIWDKDESVQFTDSAHQKRLFESMTCDLADKGYRFISINEADQIVTQTLNGLWETALCTKLILAGPKVDSADPAESDVSISSLRGYFDRFLNLMQL